MSLKWPKVQLSDLTEKDRSITYGVVKPGDEVDNGVAFIRGGDLSQGRIAIDVLRTISPQLSQIYKRTLLRGGELLISLVGNPGEVAIAPSSLQGANIARQVGLIALRPEVDAKFIMYFLMSPVGRAELFTRTGGAVQQVINLADLKTVAVPTPSLAVQQRIAEILSAYDDLIDNNRRRMALLEDSARQLYREWFVRLRFPGHEHTPVVDGVPQGWERLPATEALDINPKIKLSDAEEHWFVEMANLPTDSMVIEGAYLRDGRSGPKFQNGDTLFARITPCLENGKTGFVDFMDEGEAGRGSTEFIVLRSKRVTPEFVYCLARTYEFRGNAIKSMIGSSGRQRVQESCFEKFMVNVPPTSLLRLFSDFAEPAFEEIKNLASQNQKLRQARDLLLPRLMNGELAV